MKNSKIVSMAALLIASMGVAQAQIIISEVDPAGSAASYGADWFELKNIGASTVDITGWEMDDNSDLFSKAVPLTGVTSIAAGQSVVFIEDTGLTDSTLDASFISAWFGNNAPAGLTIGNYGGPGVGLSQTADAVNIFDSTGTPITSVTFGASTLGFTFDNEAGINSTTTPITQLSAVGVNGAFLSANGVEVGSPGDVAPVPEPSTLALAGFMGLATSISVRRLKNRQS